MLAPQDLTCPDPAACPVLDSVDALDFSACSMAAGTPLHRVYDGVRGYDEANPGYGDTRFAPFDDPDTRQRVPFLYLAQTDTAALLEGVFHDVHQSSDRRIGQSTLLGRLLAYVVTPRPMHLLDLRDEQLARLGLGREQLVSTSAEHYPCTRRIAVSLYRRPVDGPLPQGLVWHSRVAELAGGAADESLIVFANRYPTGHGTWPLARPGLRALYEGAGRLRVDEIAESLAAVVVVLD